MFLPERLPDWSDRLLRTIERHRVCRFAWGSFDCATLFDDAARAVTGESPMEGLGPWPSERAALRLLRRLEAKSVRECVEKRLPAVPPSTARRGDVGYTDKFDRFASPSIIVGAQAVSRDEHGWLVFPASLLTACFRVGR